MLFSSQESKKEYHLCMVRVLNRVHPRSFVNHFLKEIKIIGFRFTSIILVFISFVCACISTHKMHKGSAGASAISYAVQWSAILAIVVSVLGTLVMRRYRSHLALGFLSGIICVMSSQMIILFAICLNYAEINSYARFESTVAIVAFFLSFVYAVFGTMLLAFSEKVAEMDHFNPTDESSSGIGTNKQGHQENNNKGFADEM